MAYHHYPGKSLVEKKIHNRIRLKVPYQYSPWILFSVKIAFYILSEKSCWRLC